MCQYNFLLFTFHLPLKVKFVLKRTWVVITNLMLLRRNSGYIETADLNVFPQRRLTNGKLAENNVLVNTGAC